MEEIGPQVAPPIFIHQSHGPRFCESHPLAKKRSLPLQPAGFSHHQNLADTWNPKAWNWDTARFVAKPLDSDVLWLGTAASDSQNRRVGQVEAANASHVNEDDESLRLKLGGGDGGNSGSLSLAEEPLSRPGKRVRSGSPGASNQPMCQVDNCKENLSNAKDYHRRHKVCEAHSKASKALVGKQMQRFCQQCSRFHPLSEFDEGKRSCRRRLAGHNRRRRKTQPEDTTTRLLVPGNHESSTNRELDIVNLLKVLAHSQGSTEGRSANLASVPDKDQLVQILGKINSLPLPASLAAKLHHSGSFNGDSLHQSSSVNQSRLSANTSSPSTMDLLAVLSATPAAPTPDALEIESQRSSQGSDSERTKSALAQQTTSFYLQKGLGQRHHSVGGERSSASNQSPAEDLDFHAQEIDAHLPLQLFSSSPEDHIPPRLAAGQKYFSSDSSNRSEERSPSSSPLEMQKLFPLHTTDCKAKPENRSTNSDGDANDKATRVTGCITSLQLFGGSTGGADNCSAQSSPYQTGYTSSSGSDHSPSSFNSEAQDRTGRIIFKLFDKDPSHLPGTLRTQIFNWLSNIPSEMESYIRPGCIILSIYLSMSPSAWQQFEENLLHHVNALVHDLSTDFWRSGRFLIHTEKRLASHRDGRIHLCKSGKAWNSPELLSVSPLAVVGGQQTSLLLRGRNLTVPGTKFSCTHANDYTIKQVSSPAYIETAYDEISLGSFTVHGGAPMSLGRCFIEVENGFRGSSFPVIIADSSICRELRLLESEINQGTRAISVDHGQDLERPSSREEILHFLNELGWLFQRTHNSSMFESPDYKLGHLKFLLGFSVEHDFCALVKKLLDILVEINQAREGLVTESLVMLSEIHLLNRAVKRRSRKMVDVLLQYFVVDSSGTSKRYIFPPNLVGPGGLTPLHLAASSSCSDDMVDSLTSDPEEIGLKCWNSLLDANGLSPYAYALMKGNHSYNKIVAQKLADRRNGQVSVSVRNEIEQHWLEVDQECRSTSQFNPVRNSCAKCATSALRYNRRVPGSGLLYRPYIHSMLAIAAVCVCVCLFFRGAPDIGQIAPFKWENLGYGSM